MRCNPIRLMLLVAVSVSLAACDGSPKAQAGQKRKLIDSKIFLDRAKEGPTEQDMRNLELANKWFGNRDPRMTNDSLKRLQEAEQRDAQQPRRYGR
jgi:hypothetical protein